jgi:transposase
MSVQDPGAVERQSIRGRRRRRRSYTAEQKRRFVEETMLPGASVSLVAQRHDINANLLFTWRRQMRDDRLDEATTGPSEGMQFIPLGVVGGDASHLTALARPLPTAGGSAEKVPAAGPERARPSWQHSTIEIELPNGARLRVGTMIEAAVLRQVISVLKEAW